MQIKKILYTTDFSDFSLCALPYALDMCQKYQAELHCLHVVDEAAHSFWMGGVPDDMVLATVPSDQIRQGAEKQMADWVQRHIAPSGIQATRMVSIGPPFFEIIRYAKEQVIDLIVMATHGRGGIASVLMGGVAEKVVRKAPCAVLTIRHPGHHFEMP